MLSSTNNEWPWQEPKERPARGAFIVIEGMDRAGKTTQAKKLCDTIYRDGGNVKMMRFPGWSFFIF